MITCALRNVIVTGAAIALSLLLAGCSSDGLDNLMAGNPSSQHMWEKPGDRISIPFEWHDGHLMIPVRVNGSADLRLAFDTGAAATVVFQTERTQSLGLAIEQTIRIGGDAEIEGTLVDIVNDATISLNGIRLTDMTILHVALSNSHLFGSLDEAYFDGAIGYDLLRRFVTEIDYINRTITFSCAQESGEFDPPWQTLPIDLSGRVPVITAQLQGGDSSQESVSLIIDSGAPFYLYLNPDLIEGVGIPPRHFLMRGKGFYGPTERITGRPTARKLPTGAAEPSISAGNRRRDRCANGCRFWIGCSGATLPSTAVLRSLSGRSGMTLRRREFQGRIRRPGARSEPPNRRPCVH